MGQNLKHKTITNTAIPYFTNTSITDDRLRLITSSSNILTSSKGFLERAPGFAAYTADDYASSESIKRFFTWRRWDGTFYVMICVIESAPSTFSKVYKVKVGTDTTFQLIHTDSTSAEPFDFAVANNHIFFCNGTDMKKWDGTTVTGWGITGPSAAVSTALAAGALSPTTGYKYVIAWENSTTGHISSPSPLMAAFVIPSAQNVTITGNTTSDAQADKVRIYRTADGGSSYFEHPSSPIAYSTWAASGLVDSSADTALKTNTAPAQDQNDPPPAAYGLRWYAGRLWVFVGDKAYYSGFEEIPLGTSDMREECFPPDNYYSFGQQVKGLGLTGGAVNNLYDQSSALIVLCDIGINKVTGDTRANFKRETITKSRGLKNRACVTEHDKLTVWLDASNTIQSTDAVSVQELSIPIRDRIESITHADCSLASFDDGTKNWIVLLAKVAQNANIFAYDVDVKMWMPPWHQSTVLTQIGSGEIAAGTKRLFLANDGKPEYMTTGAYLFNGAAFTAIALLGLLPISDNPDDAAAVRYVAVERNNIANAGVAILTDEDPSVGGGTNLATISGNPADPPLRTNGQSLIEKRYSTESGPVARRASLELTWAAANSNFKLYSIDIAYESRPA